MVVERERLETSYVRGSAVQFRWWKVGAYTTKKPIARLVGSPHIRLGPPAGSSCWGSGFPYRWSPFQADNPRRDTLVWAIVGGSIVTSATLALGIVFGATRRALWLWLAIPAGSFAQIVGYLVFMESTAASDLSGADISVGVGAFF